MGLKSFISERFGSSVKSEKEDYPYELGGEASVNVVVVEDPNDDHADEIVKTPGQHPVRDQGSGPIIGI